TASSESTPWAPPAVDAFTASTLRSWATTSWPCSISRRVMLAPMRPSPIIAILTSRHVLEPVDLDAQDATIVGLKALEVAEGLGVDERAEVVVEARDRQLRRRRARRQLDGDHRRGPALVELTGRVQEARAVAGGHR